MSLSEGVQKKLTEIVAAGAAGAAATLGEFTHNSWEVTSVTLSLEEAGPFADLLASTAADTYGSRVTFPGGSFLLLYSGKSGYLISSAFTRDFQDRVEGMPKREAMALGEATNILLNPFVGTMAKAWGTGLIISAPKTGVSSRRDHLTASLERYKTGEKLGATFAVALSSKELFSECLLLLFLDDAFIAKLPS